MRWGGEQLTVDVLSQERCATAVAEQRMLGVVLLW